jgi:hypothetical protein
MSKRQTLWLYCILGLGTMLMIAAGIEPLVAGRHYPSWNILVAGLLGAVNFGIIWWSKRQAR